MALTDRPLYNRAGLAHSVATDFNHVENACPGLS